MKVQQVNHETNEYEIDVKGKQIIIKTGNGIENEM